MLTRKIITFFLIALLPVGQASVYVNQSFAIPKKTSFVSTKLINPSLTGLATGQEAEDINTAVDTATNAVENNFLLTKMKEDKEKYRLSCEDEEKDCDKYENLKYIDEESDKLQAEYANEKDKQKLKELIYKVADLYKDDLDKYGITPETLHVIASVESSMNPDAVNEQGYVGLYQFSKRLANSYGFSLTKEDFRKDPTWATVGGAIYAKDNADFLKKHGIDITPKNLYLAHQQGIGGAQVLLKYPNMNAVEALRKLKVYRTGKKSPEKAIRQNGGNLKMKAKDFVNMWHEKFDKRLKAMEKKNSAEDNKISKKGKSEVAK